jgi:hypothetical protein
MLTPIGFRLTINSTEFANVEYFCVAASLPALSLPEISSPFRNQLGKLSGDTIDYSSFSVTFIVDEEMRNYLEIFDWIEKNANVGIQTKDVTLSILSNQNTTNKQVQFLNAFPTSLNELEFNTQTTAVEYLTCNVEFAYDRFKFV